MSLWWLLPPRMPLQPKVTWLAWGLTWFPYTGCTLTCYRPPPAMSDEFMQMITRSVAQPVLPSTPPRRKIRTKQLDMQSTPRRSSRLAKKACNCVLAVVEAPMCSCASSALPKASIWSQGISNPTSNCSRRGLSEAQVQMIKELFMGTVLDMFLAAATET
jgi:hypothetical protein